MVAATQMTEPAVVEPEPEQDNPLAEILRKRQAARAAACERMMDLANEVSQLDYESEPLNEAIERCEGKPQLTLYQARLDAICARERELFLLLRKAIVAFCEADVLVACAGGHPACSFITLHLKREEPVRLSDELRADPLWAEQRFEFEGDFESIAMGGLDLLSTAYPELA